MAAAVTLYEHAYPSSGSGAALIMVGTFPVMPPGWNDRVSCVEFVGLGGGLVIYDKTFYRNQLTTIVNVGMTHINLAPSVNDKMSSGVHI